MLMTVEVGQDCHNSAESGGNHVNDGDGNGFAIVTSAMEVEAQSRIDDSEKGEANKGRIISGEGGGVRRVGAMYTNSESERR